MQHTLLLAYVSIFSHNLLHLNSCSIARGKCGKFYFSKYHLEFCCMLIYHCRHTLVFFIAKKNYNNSSYIPSMSSHRRETIPIFSSFENRNNNKNGENAPSTFFPIANNLSSHISMEEIHFLKISINKND